MQKHFTVMVDWDDEAALWYVGESDVPGLAAEADSIDLLREKLARLIPELIDLNRHKLDVTSDVDVPVFVQTRRLEHFAVRH